ncbi:MAG: hypothetical protein QOE17_1066, partial [Gaiellales bacterium]|nr:hypothetical protein [Gaiellales bacterium]
RRIDPDVDDSENVVDDDRSTVSPRVD